MKILTLSALCALLSVNAFASEVPDCYREADVTPGQFVILMDQYIRDAGKRAVIDSLADLNLSVVDSFGDTLVVERTASSRQTRRQELATLKGLGALIGNGVEAIECSGSTAVGGPARPDFSRM